MWSTAVVLYHVDCSHFHFSHSVPSQFSGPCSSSVVACDVWTKSVPEKCILGYIPTEECHVCTTVFCTCSFCLVCVGNISNTPRSVPNKTVQKMYFIQRILQVACSTHVWRIISGAIQRLNQCYTAKSDWSL